MSEARHQTWVAVVAVAASIIVVLFAVFLAFYSQRSFSKERAQRSLQINGYLAKQCDRDRRKDVVITGILQRSIDNVLRSRAANPDQIEAYVEKTRADIAAIRAIDRQCIADIPPPITQ